MHEAAVGFKSPLDDPGHGSRVRSLQASPLHLWTHPHKQLLKVTGGVISTVLQPLHHIITRPRNTHLSITSSQPQSCSLMKHGACCSVYSRWIQSCSQSTAAKQRKEKKTRSSTDLFLHMWYNSLHLSLNQNHICFSVRWTAKASFTE